MMKISKNFLIFFGIIASTLCTTNAKASLVNCPSGCFCLNNGKYDTNGQVNPDGCNAKGQLLQSCYGMGLMFYGGFVDCNHNTGATYYFDQFSEIYEGYYGFYGVINGNMIYMPRDYMDQSVYDCPASYPHSDSGAKTIYECYKYDSRGNKVYYSISASTGGTGGGTGGSMSGGTGGNGETTVTCAEGTYLPANATECVACSAEKHHICPGGTFSTRNNTKIKGLKVECYPGEYLPRGAIQCSSCESEHLCLGGIYNVDGLTDIGTVMNSGYVFNGNHTVEICNPGYYMPGSSQTCVACTGNYACPGGIFYTNGGPYQTSRGRIFCGYGHANDTHTACISTSTSPSFMIQQLQMPSATTTQTTQPEMSVQQPQSVEKKQQSQQQQTPQRLSSGKRQSGQSQKISQQMVAAAKTQTIRTQTTEQQSNSTTTEDELETAKKLISAGVAAPLK